MRAVEDYRATPSHTKKEKSLIFFATFLCLTLKDTD
jgi:hypothetical protein